jgi:hypothetical protein
LIFFSKLRRRLTTLGDRWLLPPAENPQLVEAVAQRVLHCELVLISQIQRSGGTVFSQLLDGHPKLWIFPGELHLGKPKEHWPRLLLWLPPAILFRMLVDHRCIEYARDGFKKSKLSTERLAFDYDVGLHCAAFCRACRQRRPRSQREILDIYFSTFFGSWRNFYAMGSEPKYFCAFTADLALHPSSVRGYLQDYPAGRLISIVRDPSTWSASAVSKGRTTPKFSTFQKAMDHWRKAARALGQNKLAAPERVLLLAFRDVIGRTEATMKLVSDELQITFDPAMLVPTFNREPIQSNSSFTTAKGKIDKAVLTRRPVESASEQDQAQFLELLKLCSDPGTSLHEHSRIAR